jgi:hypothetical protein
VLEATGVAIDAAGRIVVSGGAGANLASGGCFHDDWFPSLTYAGFVARFTESGGLDASFAGGGVFGGRSQEQVPLAMEFTTEPVIASGGEIILQRGGGACLTTAGSLGYFRLTAAGTLRSARDRHELGGRVAGAGATADGSTVLLVGPEKGSEAPPWIVELRPDGSRVKSFGNAGKRTLPLPEPGWSYVDRLRVAPDGEIFARGTIVPRPGKHENNAHWHARFSTALFGLTAKGKLDPRVGRKGFAAERFPLTHVPEWEEEGLWVDASNRPTLTVAYRGKKEAPNGLAIARFEAP